MTEDETTNDIPQPTASKRRFGIAPLLLITAMYALLFGLLKWFQVGEGLCVLTVIFFTTVGLGRVFLFRGRRPVLAAAMVGGGFGVLFGLHAVVQETSQCPLGMCVVQVSLFVLLGSGCALVAAALIEGPFLLLTRRPSTRGALIFAGLVLIALMLQRPLRIAFHVYRYELAFQEMSVSKKPSPIRPLLLSLMTGGDSSDLYSDCIEGSPPRLVELGYLSHRKFVFKHIASSCDEGKALWRLVEKEFPGNLYVAGSWPGTPEPFHLSVWERPHRMAEWEAFVSKYDVPDFRERYMKREPAKK